MKKKIYSILFTLILSAVIFSLQGCQKEHGGLDQIVSDKNHLIPEGTFIQAHLVYNWNDEQWQKELKALKEVGMKYIVFGPVLHTGMDGQMISLYQTPFTGNQNDRYSDLVEQCLKNAQKANFKVFLGLNFHERWWSGDGDEAWLLDQMNIGNTVADELINKYKDRYGDSMYGWYWVWEVANIPELLQQKYKDALVNALNINLTHLHKVTPNMPFMLCPFMNYRIGDAHKYAESWEYIFERTHFQAGDIFAPQDCVGAGGLELRMIPEWFEALGKAVKKKTGLQFWSDAETFEQKYWASAPLNRFVEQLNLTAPYVEKVITFAYSHYYSPNVVNKKFHEAYLYYVKNGKLPDTPQPPPVSEVSGKRTSNILNLTWKAPGDISNVVGFYIYKDGEKIGNIQFAKDDKFESKFTDDNALTGKLHTYEVSTYNSIGKESARIKAQMN
ncbi:MAG TPA: DUF4434 domain-containing protein [Bacteroidales bacterium]|nr:DUF4434 domain-containing protein [Bacteroidales bacterium]